MEGHGALAVAPRDADQLSSKLRDHEVQLSNEGRPTLSGRQDHLGGRRDAGAEQHGVRLKGPLCVSILLPGDPVSREELRDLRGHPLFVSS